MIQITRVDWENSGPYEECTVCPMAAAASRMYGIAMWHMGPNYLRAHDRSLQLHTVKSFHYTQYCEAKAKYEAGEQILFETELK